MKSTARHAASLRPMGRPKKETSEKKVPVSTRIDPDIYAALTASAKGNRATVNHEINRLLAVALRYEKKLTL